MAKSLCLGCEGHTLTSTRTHALGASKTATLDSEAEKHARQMQAPCVPGGDATDAKTRPRHPRATSPCHPHKGLRGRPPMTWKRKRGRTREGPLKKAVDPPGGAVTQRSHWARGGRTASVQGTKVQTGGGQTGQQAGPSGLACDREAGKACRQGCHGGGDGRGPAARRTRGTVQRVTKGRRAPHTQAAPPFTQSRAAGVGTGAWDARDAHTVAGRTTAPRRPPHRLGP